MEGVELSMVGGVVEHGVDHPAACDLEIPRIGFLVFLALEAHAEEVVHRLRDRASRADHLREQSERIGHGCWDVVRQCRA